MTKISQWVSKMASETPESALSVVGQGSALGKPSLHMVGYMGKNTEAFSDGSCPACKAMGQAHSLRTYRISFTQSIFLCANPQCIYPLGYTPLDNIITNTADLKKCQSPTKPRKRSNLEAPITTKFCVKKSRTEISVCVEDISHNVSLPQNNGLKNMQGLMTPVCDLTRGVQSIQCSDNRRKHQEQNVLDTTSNINTGISGLYVNQSYSAAGTLPHGKPSSALLQIDLNEPQKEAAQNKAMEITDTLNSSPIQHNGHSVYMESCKYPVCTFTSSPKILNRQKPIEQSVEMTLSGELAVLNNAPTALNAVSQKNESNNSSLTEWFQGIQSEMEESTFMEVPHSLCSGLFVNGSSSGSQLAALHPDHVDLKSSFAVHDAEQIVCDVSLSNNLLEETQTEHEVLMETPTESVLRDGSDISLTTAEEIGNAESLVLVQVSQENVHRMAKNTNTFQCSEEATVKDNSNVSLAAAPLAEQSLIQHSQEKKCNGLLSNNKLQDTEPEQQVEEKALVETITSLGKEAAFGKASSNISLEVTFFPDCGVKEPLILAPDKVVCDPLLSNNVLQEARNGTQIEGSALIDMSSPLCSEAIMQKSSVCLETDPMPECDVSEPYTLLQDGVNLQSGRKQQIDIKEVANPARSPKLLRNGPDVVDSVSSSSSSSSEKHLQIQTIVTKTNHFEVTNVQSLQHQPDAKEISPLHKDGVQCGNGHRYLQWRNKYSLCWLDCIMSALVHSTTLKTALGKKGTKEESILHQLFTKYNKANALLTPSGKKGHTKNLAIAEKSLKEVRFAIFDKLKPLLKCKLGKNESPVFAFPLLLQQDPAVEKLFVHSYYWKFECKNCGHQQQERCQKTLTTFTSIMPEWHPLNAIHRAPCNNCQDSAQKRTFVLEKIHSIFMFHFVEGLPHNKLKLYSFQFEGQEYEICTVIQYHNCHFVTWISNADGLWLKFDDLDGPFCKTSKCFDVPPAEIHIVIWERNNSKTMEETHSQPCSMDPEFQELNVVNQSISYPDPDTNSPDLDKLATQTLSTPVMPDSSNLLSGLEGYAEDDIITLTLVEIPVDPQGKPLENNVVAREPLDLPPEEVQLKFQGRKVSECLPNDTLLEVPKNYLLPVCGDQEKSSLLPSESTNSQTIINFKARTIHKPCPDDQGHHNTDSVSDICSVTNEKHSNRSLPNGSRKSVVGSWMKSLLNKNPAFLTSNLYGSNKKTNVTNHNKAGPLLKTTDAIAKKAENFGGFKSKGLQKVGYTPTLNASSKPENCSLHDTIPKKDKVSPPAESFLVPTVSNPLTYGRNGINYKKFLGKNESMATDDKIRRLRLKLLKKLKAKKNELASLEMLAKSQNNEKLRSDHLKPTPELNGVNKHDYLRGFLQELQDHIDNVDNESVCTMSSSTSICSSPGDAEFFADLFSPVSSNTAKYANDDSRFLEMLVDGYDSSFPSSNTTDSCSANPQKMHIYNNPVVNVSHLKSTTEIKPCLEASSSESSTREKTLGNLLSSSALHLFGKDDEYFPPFNDLF